MVFSLLDKGRAEFIPGPVDGRSLAAKRKGDGLLFGIFTSASVIITV